MALTVYGRVPDWMVGPTATTAATAVLLVALFVSLVLAMVQMKTEKLSAEVRAALQKTQPAAGTSVLSSDAEQPVAPRRRRQKVRRSRLQRMVLQFFIAEEGSEDETSSSEGDEGPYQLDDGCWRSPDEVHGGSKKPTEHFIGEAVAADSAGGGGAAAGAWGLADHVWREPAALATSS
eukprot:gb/GFBE01020183.1/.p1 GENE.gb/GFBE01020183.1/~~gb/GFBE01020183.1/.p1  ORF type:complete len:178 (+),score=47.50 gb/GFBE01020183.1/:1-534(+)